MKLIIAEKPKVARQIAPLVGATSKEDGFIEGNGYAVTWAFGHLVGLKMPQDYNADWKKWDSASLPIVPEQFGLKVTGDEGVHKQYEIIESLLQNASEVICATDAGREGELIFRYIYELAGCTAPIKRLWASSLTPEALQVALDNLRSGDDYDNLAAAAKCRSKADWLVGLNATRGFTTIYKAEKPLSVGRVQTPVLKLIVERRKAIDNFEPKPFWECFAEYRETKFKADLDRFTDEEKAKKWYDSFGKDKLTVTGVEANERREKPPLLFDLTELQREMNKRHKWEAAKTLSMLQELYENGFVTYPRTDSRYLSNDLLDDVTEALGKHVSDVVQLEALDLSTNHRSFNDGKVTDHHAIIPTSKSPSGSWKDDEKTLYEIIVNRTIACFSPDCIKEITTVSADVDGIDFKAKGTVVKEEGWRAIEKTSSNKKEEVMPSFKEGESGGCEIELVKGMTSPPKEYNDASLLTAMETAGKGLDDEEVAEVMKERGLGTPATRSGIIETLLKRDFIERQKHNIIATKKGVLLIEVLGDSTVTSVDLTAEWEHKLSLIEKGEHNPNDFMRHVTAYMKALVEEIKKPNQKAQEALTKASSSDSLGVCPLCDKHVTDKGKIFTCSDRKCDFVIFKTIAKKTITANTAALLVKKGKTGTLQGFTSTAGKSFSAALAYDKEAKKVVFQFENKKKRK